MFFKIKTCDKNQVLIFQENPVHHGINYCTTLNWCTISEPSTVCIVVFFTYFWMVILSNPPRKKKRKNTISPKVKARTWRFFVPFLGWLSDPFEGLSDLQLGDEKVTTWITWNQVFSLLAFHLLLADALRCGYSSWAGREFRGSKPRGITWVGKLKWLVVGWKLISTPAKVYTLKVMEVDGGGWFRWVFPFQLNLLLRFHVNFLGG